MSHTSHPQIIFQDEDLLAIDKPAGLLSVPDRFDENLPSLKRYLKEKYGEIYVIHRLDRDTSGLILFARNEAAHRYYSTMFEERKVEKTYLGWVHGTPAIPEGTIDKPIAPHHLVKGKMTVHRKGKPSVTHYRVIESFGLYSLVEFRIETGRTHQIRVHMQDLGHPVVCDALYGSAEPVLLSRLKRKFKMSKGQDAERPLMNRLALHSHTLKFTDRAGNHFLLEAPLAKDMQVMWQQMKKIQPGYAGHD